MEGHLDDNEIQEELKLFTVIFRISQITRRGVSSENRYTFTGGIGGGLCWADAEAGLTKRAAATNSGRWTGRSWEGNFDWGSLLAAVLIDFFVVETGADASGGAEGIALAVSVLYASSSRIGSL